MATPQLQQQLQQLKLQHPPTIPAIENLVFKGGGVKGLAFAGALIVLEQYGVLNNIKRLAGSSAGAITASLIAVGYTPQELLDILSKQNFEEFKDDDIGFLRDAKRFLTEFGFYKGNVFCNWIKSLIAKKNHGTGDITFAQLLSKFNKELVITGTSLNRRETHYFGPNTTPDMKVWEAVRISMSIPLFFSAVERDGNIYVDGGVLDNFPIYIFDCAEGFNPKEALVCNLHNNLTLGLKLESDSEKIIASTDAPPKIKDMKDYVDCLLECVLGHIEHLKIKPKDESRTIRINTRYISPVDFDISENEKKLLVHEGMKAAESFFKLSKTKEYLGFLIVDLVEAKNIFNSGVALPIDPYCIVRLESIKGEVKDSYKTGAKHLTVNPSWNKRIPFKIDSLDDNIVIEMLTVSIIGKDKHFSKVSIPVRFLSQYTADEGSKWYPLANTKNSEIHLNFLYSPNF